MLVKRRQLILLIWQTQERIKIINVSYIYIFLCVFYLEYRNNDSHLMLSPYPYLLGVTAKVYGIYLLGPLHTKYWEEEGNI